MSADVPAGPVVSRRRVGHGRLDREVGRECRLAEAEHGTNPDADDDVRTTAAAANVRPCQEFTSLFRHNLMQCDTRKTQQNNSVAARPRRPFPERAGRKHDSHLRSLQLQEGSPAPCLNGTGE